MWPVSWPMDSALSFCPLEESLSFYPRMRPRHDHIVFQVYCLRKRANVIHTFQPLPVYFRGRLDVGIHTVTNDASFSGVEERPFRLPVDLGWPFLLWSVAFC